MPSLPLLKEIEVDILSVLNEINNLSSKEDKQLFFRKRRDIYIKENRSFINKSLNLLLSSCIEGKEIDVSNLDPYLEIISEKEQIERFKIFRFLSTYPFAEAMGRRIKFFIRDKFHRNNPVMGIGCISSPVINISARDNYVGWTSNDPNKFAKLKNIVELSCAVAIPPYNELCVGKLIALSALSVELINHYREKYNEPNSYVLISGTGLYGKNCTLFNRLKLDGKPAYTYIGETKGFTHIHVNPNLYSKIEEAAECLGIKLLKGHGFFTNRRLKNIENVFYRMSIPYRKLLILPLRKAIFVAPTASNYRDILLGKEKEPFFYDYETKCLFDYWKSRWMNLRLQNAGVIDRIKNFKTDAHLKTLLV